MKTSESIIKIVPALLEAQKAMGAAKKDAVNPYYHSSYADLGSVMETCKELLNKNNITVLQPIMGTTVETILLHSSGEWMSSETPIVCKVEHDPQALGSAITYARRYGLQSMVFIPSADDDANTASNKPTTTPAAQPRMAYDPVAKQAVPSTVKAPGTTIYCSEKQVQLIAILLKQKGQSDEELNAKYKVEHKKELSKAMASQIIDNLLKLPSIDEEPPVESEY